LGKFGVKQAGEFDAVNFEMLKASFDDVWSRREELKPVIIETMKKDQERFRAVSAKIGDLFQTLNG
jgi:hypothetical protein